MTVECAKCKQEKDYSLPFMGSGVLSANFKNYYLCHKCCEKVLNFILAPDPEEK